MERSWWIVLVLICNLAHGQINSGAIGNNRFLQRTNPQIDRAIADGGSSLDHPEVQKLARQMVDMGIWSNLKFWIHYGLLEERISGSDVFCPKAYDISGGNNDPIQATTANQPKIFIDGIEFDGTNDRITVSTLPTNTTDNASVMFWWKPLNLSASRWLFQESSANNVLQAFFDSGSSLFLRILNKGMSTATSTASYSVGTWYCTVGTYRLSGNTFTTYRNGVQTNTGTNARALVTTVSSVNFGANAANTGFYNYVLGEFRYFDKELSASEVDALFEESKSKYGY